MATAEFSKFAGILSVYIAIHGSVYISLPEIFPTAGVWASLVAQETQVQPLGWEIPLEKGMVTHPSILAQRMPWAEEPGGLQSMGL